MSRSPIYHGRARRIARVEGVNTRVTTSLWSELRASLDHAVEPKTPRQVSHDEWSSFYTVARANPRSWADEESERQLLPAPLREIPNDRLGFIEAELLDWVYNYPSLKMLSVVGHRGAGKSSLLRHVFHHLWTDCAYLQGITPVIVDLTSWDADLNYQSLAFNIVSSIRWNANLDELHTLPPPEIDQLQSDIRAATGHGTILEIRILLQDVARRLATKHGGDDSRKKVIFIFDNCDHLPPEKVHTVLATARFLAEIERTGSIVALRPFMFQTQMEQDFGLGSLVLPSVDVPPPDFSKIIEKRIQAQERQSQQGRVVVGGARGLDIEFSSAAEAMRYLCRFFLAADTQATILVGLCNYDIRRALRATRSFFRSQKVPVEHFKDWFVRESTRVPHQRMLDYLLAGIMCDDNHLYQEEMAGTRNVVMNIFDLGTHIQPLHYRTQFRLLATLYWLDDLTTTRDIRHKMARLGYDPRSVDRAIAKLFDFRLVHSPQNEILAANVREIRISSAGRFYIESLIGQPEYLFNAATDTPLEHGSWESERHDFLKRIRSMEELCRRIAHEEDLEANQIHPQAVPWSASVMDVCGMMSARIYNAITSLLENAAKFSSVDHIRSKAPIELERIELELKPCVEQAQGAQEKLRSKALKPQPYRAQDDYTEVRVPIQDSGQATIALPKSFSKHQSAIIEVEIDPNTMKQRDQVDVFLSFDNALHRDSSGHCLTFGSGKTDNTGRIIVQQEGAPSDSAPSGTIWIASFGAVIGRGEF